MFPNVSATLCGMDEAGKIRAGKAVARAMARQGWDAPDLARAAGIPDPQTVRNLVNKGTWPRPRTRAKLEEALGWAPGDLYNAAAGDMDDAGDETDDPVVAAIKQSPLSRGNKAALLSTYYDMIDAGQQRGA